MWRGELSPRRSSSTRPSTRAASPRWRPPEVEPVETTPPTTPAPGGDPRRSSLSRPPHPQHQPPAVTPGGRACRDHPTHNTSPRRRPPEVEPVETTPPTTPAPGGAHRWSSLSRPPHPQHQPPVAPTGGRACRDHPAGNVSPRLVRAADPFLRVFSTCPGVKDGLRPPASPAASRSWTPGHVEKKHGWLSARRPGCGAEKSSPWKSSLSRPPNPQQLPRSRKKKSYRAT
ncbi:hypothetical protein J2S40_002709 [Nocardioides luteus]|nr:hypothetical protein [Nocardioides luteus]